jgi:hypothetical protein
MRAVAAFARSKGWPMPTPADPLDLLAKDFSRAAREVVERDAKTGKPYRRYHAYTQGDGAGQLTLWINIDAPTTTRKKMHKSLTQRREQMIGDGLQLCFDAAHWSSTHPDEEPIEPDMNLTDEIEWRQNSPDEDEEKKAS